MTVATFGGPTPNSLGLGPSVPNFPTPPGSFDYIDATGSIIVPAGALDGWFTYRRALGATRGDVIVYGDSTTWGSGALYSYCQRLRDNATGASTGGPAGFGIADGGKGIFGGGENFQGDPSPMTYDAPEINGWVSSTFAGNPDGFDVLDGGFYYDDAVLAANHTLVLQFRTTGCRIWYSQRQTAGDFTYSVDGGAPVTVQAYNPSGTSISRYVYVSGLSAGTTHSLTITNLAVSTNGGPGSGAKCWVGLSPVNASGVVFQKFALSGDTLANRYFGQLPVSPFTGTVSAGTAMRYQVPLGLVATSVGSPSYRGAIADSAQPVGGTINPVLAITNLGFNDLTNAVDSSDVPMWTESVKRFAGACSDARCPGIVVSGQLPYNANWPTFGAARFNALKTQALASGLAFVDLFYPIGGPALNYSGGTGQPHLTKTQYQLQADFLWNNLLGLD